METIESNRVRLLVIVTLSALLLLASQGVPAAQAELMVMGIHPHQLIVFDTNRDEVIAEIQLHGRAPKEIECSHDGRHLYVTTEGRSQIEIVDFSNRKVEDVIHVAPAGYKAVIYGTALSRDEKLLYIHIKPVRLLPDEYQAESPRIIAYDFSARQSRTVGEVPEGVASLIALGDGKHLIAWGRDLYTIDVTTGRIVNTFALQGPSSAHSQLNSLPLFSQYEQSGIYSMPFYTNDPMNGKDLMGLVNIEVETGKIDLLELGPAVPLFSAVVSPDHARAYAVMNQLVAVDLKGRRVIKVLDLDRTKYVTNISRDGRKLYVSGAAPFMDVYDTASLKQIKKIELSGDGSVTALRVIPQSAVP